jgi:hypothetical protein
MAFQERGAPTVSDVPPPIVYTGGASTVAQIENEFGRNQEDTRTSWEVDGDEGRSISTAGRKNMHNALIRRGQLSDEEDVCERVIEEPPLAQGAALGIIRDKHCAAKHTKPSNSTVTSAGRCLRRTRID